MWVKALYSEYYGEHFLFDLPVNICTAWAIRQSSLGEGSMLKMTASRPYCEAFVSSFNGNFSLKCFKNSCDGQFVLEMIE